MQPPYPDPLWSDVKAHQSCRQILLKLRGSIGRHIKNIKTVIERTGSKAIKPSVLSSWEEDTLSSFDINALKTRLRHIKVALVILKRADKEVA